jgi:Tfp pilus assembly protein PilF
MQHHRAGQLLEAEKLYGQVLAIDRHHVASLHHLGIIALQRGQPQAAVDAIGRAIGIDDGVPALHYDIACAFQMLGRPDEAAAHYRHAIRLRPDHAEAHNNLANTLADQGQSDEAVLHFRRAIELNPSFVEAHINLGGMLLAQGQLDGAAAHFGRALGFNANIAEAHANLGDVCLAQGRVHDAVERYQRALALKPELAEVHNKLGVALAALGRFEEAGRRFEAALSRKPEFIDAYGNLARTLLSLGQAQDALIVLKRALAIAETPEIKSLFVQCVRCLPVLPNADDFRAIMLRALSEQVAAKELLGGEGFAAIVSNRLLHGLLESAPVCDVGLEQLLTRIRLAMLEAASTAETGSLADPIHPGVLRFCCTLARQCFLNEYVFACTDTELAEAHRLRDTLAAALATGVAVPELIVAVVAAYVPLCSLASAELLLDRSWFEPLAGVLIQQVREPAQERELRAAIPALTVIADGVSCQVAGNTRRIRTRAGRTRSRRNGPCRSISICEANFPPRPLPI